LILVAEQSIGGALHVRDIVGMRTDAAQNAKHALDEKRRLDNAALEEIRGRVQMADVVALDLEARAVVGARRQNVFDILEGVAEDPLVRCLEIRALPVELELPETLEHRKQSEVHRA